MIRCQANLRFSISALVGSWLVCALILTSPKSAWAQTDQQYRLAAGLYARGQWDEAEKAFAQLIAKDASSDQGAAAAFFLAEAQMQQGKFAKAFTAFQSFLRQHPSHPYAARATFRMGEGAFRTARYDVAVRLLEAFAKENPNHELNEFALPYLGQLRNLRLEPQLAQMAFESALKSYPDGKMANPCRLGLAKALQAQSHVPGNRAEAKRFYLYLQDQFEPAVAAEARIQLGVMNIDALDFEAAEVLLNDALKITSAAELRAKANYWLARIQLAQEDYDEALKQLSPWVDAELSPSLMTSVWFDGAVAATRQSPPEFSKALRWLSRIRTTYPKSKRLLAAVRFEIDLLRKLGQTDKALELATRYQLDDYQQVVKQQALEQNARGFYEQQEFGKAAVAFTELIDQATGEENRKAIGEKLDGWRYLKSLSLIGLGDFKNAESTLEQIERSSEATELSMLRDLALATTRFGQQKYAQAIADYQRYLERDDQSDEAIRAKTELAICLAKTSQASAASEMLGSIDRDGVEHVDAYETAVEIVAEACLQQKETKLAADWLERLQRFSQNQERIRRLQMRVALAGTTAVEGDVVSATAFLTLLKKQRQDDVPGEPLEGNAKAICQAALAFATKLPKTKSEDAKKIYASLIETTRDPGLANIARIQLARMLQKEGRPAALAEATKLLTDYLKSGSTQQQPVRDEVIYQLAWLQHDAGDKLGFQQRLEQLIGSQPESKYWADAAYRLTKLYVRRGDYKNAQGMVDRLLADRQGSAVPREILARTRFLQGQMAVAEKDWDVVESAMMAAQSLPLSDAMMTQAVYWTAESQFQQGENELALKTFESLRRATHSSNMSPKHRPWVELRTAQLNGKLMRWQQAEAYSREALKKLPHFAARYEFHFLIARSLEQKGLLADAQVEFQKTIDLAPGTEIAAMAQWRIGEACFHQEAYAKAIQAYYKVDSLYDFPQWRSAALVQAAKCQERLSNMNNAVKLYEQLIETFPESKHVTEAKARLAKIKRKERTAVRPAGTNR